MLVAVYGTLKKGHRNHGFLDGAKFVKKSHTGDGYALFVDELPYLVKRDDGKGCEVEIYSITDQILEGLDYLEGHPVFYERVVLRVENDEPVSIYVLKQGSKKYLKKKISESKESF